MKQHILKRPHTSTPRKKVEVKPKKPPHGPKLPRATFSKSPAGHIRNATSAHFASGTPHIYNAVHTKPIKHRVTVAHRSSRKRR